MRLLTPWTTDLLDLVLARACLECGRSGRVWCIPCVASVPRDLNPASVPGNDVPLVCAARYDGHVREAIIDYKEHGNRALAPMLGQLLAEAAIAHLRGSGAPGAVIVPVPGHRRPERGFDALGGVVRAARRDVARAGLPTLVVPAVRMRRDAGPIKTLAASGIKDFGKLLGYVAQAAPLRRNVTIEDVGNVAAFLLSDLASGVTAEITYVDGGFSQTAGLSADMVG